MLLKEIFGNIKPEKHDVVYHVSPLPEFDGTRETSIRVAEDLYNKLYDELQETEDSDAYNKIEKQLYVLDKFLKNGRFHADISHIPKDSFYATTQPEYWKNVMEDELDTEYTYGGIYKVYLKRPQPEFYVPSGMGQQAPQTIVKINNVKRITGPFKTFKAAYISK